MRNKKITEGNLFGVIEVEPDRLPIASGAVKSAEAVTGKAALFTQ